MRYFIPIFAIFVLSILSFLGFRGSFTEKTPIEVFPDMDRQAKFKSQTKNALFSNVMADRLPVENTAIRGNLISQNNVFSVNPSFHSVEYKTGKDINDKWVEKYSDKIADTKNDAKNSINMSVMRLGKEKYDIHCSVCHGKYGDGKGVTSYFGLQPRNLSDPTQQNYYLKTKTDGETFNTISNGYGTMLGLKDKLTPKERWAIVLYVRCLQNFVGEATLSKNKKS
ncbi:MAG: c-type cytochrome [Opitutales bacterium]|nr:c-type cytochrome [Opitutales bacterium]